MNNLDDSENTAKISDSAYSNSCSNSQSRSRSSKLTHSGSHSSGSSGYGGKPSTSGSSLGQPPEKRSKDKDVKKKKQVQIESTVEVRQIETESRPLEQSPENELTKEDANEVLQSPSPADTQLDSATEKIDIQATERNSVKDDGRSCNTPLSNTANYVISVPPTNYSSDGFSCVISMHDGVVMYTTSSLTASLGFPKEMWIGRSFIDFIHPRDRNTFASQITSGLDAPNNGNGTKKEAQAQGNSTSTMVRIRRYRSLAAGFGVKERVVTFMPFLIKLSFKDISDEEGKVMYLVIQATPFFPAFKTPNELVTNAVPFIMRHSTNGILEYIDPESVPYLGYMPQDIVDKDALQLYHPEDMTYLRQVYEAIVKEGRVPRSKTYRMMAQNGDYVKLETEWSAFINPWSRKLEFVTGRHHVVEGPSNPDVFQTPQPNVNANHSKEDIKKNKLLRESIVVVLNKELTKSVEVAKEQMIKRCRDLASFMETLMEEQPKTEEELRLEIQDPDNSCFERDSVMLGGISPHHEYNDSKSSTETPLSYNQLNYNETLQRYFDSHQPHSYEDYHTVTGENILCLGERRKPAVSKCLSPMVVNSGDSMELTSSCESSGALGGSSSHSTAFRDYQQIRLTEALITKHNTDMEKELVKIHRENRTSSKGERVKASNEKRQKKKEHIARCNATFQPKPMATTGEIQPHGVKRAMKQTDSESGGCSKHLCTSPRKSRRRHATNMPPTLPSATITATTNASNVQGSQNAVNNMNAFILGVGLPQQISVMGPVGAMSGTPMFPMYCTPAAGPPMPSTSDMPAPSNIQFQQPAVPCMMYGQLVYGSPFMYSPINSQVSFPMQQQSMQYTQTMFPLGLANSNYEEACRPSISMRGKPATSGMWQGKKRPATQSTSLNADQESANNSNSTSALNQSTEGAPDTVTSCKAKNKALVQSEEMIDRTDGESNYSSFYSSFFKTESGSAEESSDVRKLGNKNTEGAPATVTSCKAKNKALVQSEEMIDRTDGESNYSSFYSSFFKTESGSAEESSDVRKLGNKSSTDNTTSYCHPKPMTEVARRKMDPPWMEQVCVTSELIYKYQVTTKATEDVLSADKKKMMTLDQPALVSEQLGQLYLDMQLEGVAARLTLEEGITSSSSSGEDTSTMSSKGQRRKRNYSKLVMIYEEDAPLPPPEEPTKCLLPPTPLSPPPVQC